MNRVNELKIYNFFHISSRATLKEANYNGVFLPLKETVLKFDYMNRVNELKIYNFFHICARATLKEANCNGVFILFIYFAVNITSFRVLTVHCQISSPEAII